MLRIKKHSNRHRVYGYTDHCHFGDSWAVTSYLLRLSQETGRPSRFFTKSQTVRDSIVQIRPFFRSRGRIEFAFEPPERIFHYCEPYWVKFVPTIRVWNSSCEFNSRLVAYQFDGNHLWEQKNLPSDRLHYLLYSLRKMGFIPIDVGHRRKISTIINTLANCRFFVGCPSGLSVVARSVGCPIMLITRHLDPGMKSFLRMCQYHRTNVKMFTAVDQFLAHVRRRRVRML